MPRLQVFGGYSFTRFDSKSFGFTNNTNLNGYTFSPAYNLLYGFGVVAELSGHYGSTLNFRDLAVGPQFLHSRGNSRFFAHALIGDARTLVQVANTEGDTAHAVVVEAAWITTLRHDLPSVCFSWITFTAPCLTTRRTTYGFRLGWFTTGARFDRRGTGRLHKIRNRRWNPKGSGRDLMRVNGRAGLLGTTLILAWALAWLASCGGGSGNGGRGAAGRNAFLAVPQANAIAAYRVDTSSGSFKSVLGSPFSGGTSPISIAVHPSGKFVYAANQSGNDISLFKVDSNTGELTEVLPRTAAGVHATPSRVARANR
jgi:hypothetical protein